LTRCCCVASLERGRISYKNLSSLTTLFEKNEVIVSFWNKLRRRKYLKEKQFLLQIERMI
jgi:hypothetical protein